MNTAFYAVLASAGAEPVTFSERLVYSLRMMAFGMVVVFAVLTVIWLSLTLFRVIFSALEKRKRSSDADGEDQSLNPMVLPPASAENAEETGAIVAAMTAAIAFLYAEENASGEAQKSFRVVRFRKAGGPWNQV